MIDQNSSNLPKPFPTTIVIFGASGDLTERKLIPALYTLDLEGRLPERYAVIGVARSEYTDEAFRAHLRQGAQANSRLTDRDAAAWERFASHLFYCQGAYDDPATYAALAERMAETDDACDTCGSHLFYLSTPPQLYPVIVAHLGAAGV